MCRLFAQASLLPKLVCPWGGACRQVEKVQPRWRGARFFRRTRRVGAHRVDMGRVRALLAAPTAGVVPCTGMDYTRSGYVCGVVGLLLTRGMWCVGGWESLRATSRAPTTGRTGDLHTHTHIAALMRNAVDDCGGMFAIERFPLHVPWKSMDDGTLRRLRHTVPGTQRRRVVATATASSSALEELLSLGRASTRLRSSTTEGSTPWSLSREVVRWARELHDCSSQQRPEQFCGHCDKGALYHFDDEADRQGLSTKYLHPRQESQRQGRVLDIYERRESTQSVSIYDLAEKHTPQRTRLRDKVESQTHHFATRGSSMLTTRTLPSTSTGAIGGLPTSAGDYPSHGRVKRSSRSPALLRTQLRLLLQAIRCHCRWMRTVTTGRRAALPGSATTRTTGSRSTTPCATRSDPQLLEDTRVSYKQYPMATT